MSASLVGSEMCIRDSVCPPRPPPLPAVACPPVSPKRRPVAARTGAAPVSYTHLTLPTICSV
eukprot:8015590-Alexandrium_andersonii.AAC.1